MLSAGLATIASCNYSLMDAIRGKKTMRVLCIGHGGGSLPLFLARNIQGEKVIFPTICAFVLLCYGHQIITNSLFTSHEACYFPAVDLSILEF